MILKNDFLSSCNDAQWWGSYTNLYVQDIYCNIPNKKLAYFYFRPTSFNALSFYQSCSDDVFRMITHVQLSVLEDYTKSYQLTEQRPSQIFFKIEPRTLVSMLFFLLEKMKRLRECRIELVLDVNITSFYDCDVGVQKALYEVADNGYKVCFGGYDWKRKIVNNMINNELFEYIRLGKPPANIRRVNNYIDTCFYIKENYDINLIIDGIQNESELNVSCQAPYFALMGRYLSPEILVEDANI